MAPSKPGDVVRYEEPSRPLSAAIVIVVLTGAELYAVWGFMQTVTNGWHGPRAQIFQAQMLFLIFLTLGFILMIYRRFYMPDVMVVKVRNKKYEDFIDPNRVPKVE